MGKKRKQSEAQIAESTKTDEGVPERPKRTLLGWKNKEDVEKQDDANPDSSQVFRNKEKVMVTCSRRINYRYRHLMLNMISLLPHCKNDSKVESGSSKGATLNELIELRGCSSSLFFECRKHQDLYMWMAKCPNGPSVKFLVNAVHTMEELKLTGNHLKCSRPLLTFSSNFEKDAHWKLLKEMITQIFGTPKEHRKSKPYHDHVFVFSIVDDHIWFRNYQISVPRNESAKMVRGGLDKMTLVEVGPRFCLNPIKIFAGSFGGPTLYENPFYISPNQVRGLYLDTKADGYVEEEEEDSEYVLLDLDAVFGQIDIPPNAPYTLSGLDTMNPILIIDEKLKLIGEYEETIGTCFVFSEDEASPVVHEETGPSETNLILGKCKMDSNQVPRKEVKPVARLEKILKFRLLMDENVPDETNSPK